MSRILTWILSFVLVGLIGLHFLPNGSPVMPPAAPVAPALHHWFLLERKSGIETLFYGVPGDRESSSIVRAFTVKPGVPNEKPTPLPKLAGREYWLIKDKLDTTESSETAPYFLTLDIPVSDGEPYGPVPYEECNGQCNWQIPGSFGLHGVAGDLSRLSSQNPGSSGCVRHSDEDITYIYNLLDPKKEEIRYYIDDV